MDKVLDQQQNMSILKESIVKQEEESSETTVL